MKKKISVLAGFLALILLLAAAGVLYQKLSKNAAPGNFMQETPQTEEITERTSSVKDREYSDFPSEISNAPETEAPSHAAPDFTVLDQNGEEVRLSDYKGTPIIVNFWASWCPPCKNEMPDFQNAYETYGDRIQFMMVDLTDGSRETTESAAAHIKDNGYTFPVFFDTKSSAAIAYDTSSIPASYFIDRNGNLAAYAVGMIDADSLEKGIQMLLP